MRAASSLDGNLSKTMGAFFCGGFCWWGLFFSLHAVDAANQEKDRERHNHKTDQRIDKKSVIDGHGPGLLSQRQGFVGACGGTFSQHNEQVREVTRGFTPRKVDTHDIDIPTFLRNRVQKD